MNTFNTRRYEMLVRVRDFGLAHSDLFPSSDKGGEAFAQVTAAVAALSEHSATQISGPHAARGVPWIAGEERTRRVGNIVGFARIVAKRADADPVTHVAGAGRFYIDTVTGRCSLAAHPMPSGRIR